MSSEKGKRYDVVVIGSGPGGEGAAMTAAKAGRRVAVIDRRREIGGGSVHWGTIPSKMLRHAVDQIVAFRTNPLFQEHALSFQVSFPDVLRQAHSVVSAQAKLRLGHYMRNQIDLFDGHARFVDAHTVEVIDDDGVPVDRVEAEHFVVAVGSSPYRPPDIDFTHPRVLDADRVLQLDDTPRSIVIYGAGVIGCEYASVFRNLGCKVDLINNHAKLLAFLDDEIIDALAYHLRDLGTILRHNEEYARVETLDDGMVLHLKSGKRVRADYLLWANGRSGNTDRLGLENVGLRPNRRKQIEVGETYRTEVPNIYAVGDVVGPPGLASASYDQGRFAAHEIVYGSCDLRLVRSIPTGIYTSPEISSVGPTERELTEQGVPYEVGHALFRQLARAQIVDCRVGMLKILFHRDTFAILAIHCFGYQAAEIVHIGQAIMMQSGAGNDLRYFTNMTFNYPTMAEAYRVAALNGLNRVHRDGEPADGVGELG